MTSNFYKLRASVAQFLVLSIGLCYAIQVRADVSVPLAVISLTPAPNYGPTTDTEDKSQLTDKRFNPFPFWTSRESVGWLRSTPVVIEITAKLANAVSYELILRSARQASAGVEPPRRVDIYCGAPSTSAWRHAGGMTTNVQDRTDGSVVDLAVLFKDCDSDRIRAVVHASGAFIMLDELTILHKEDSSESSSASSADARTSELTPDIPIVVDVRADSTSRLKGELKHAAGEKLAYFLHSLDASHSQAWLSEPWGQLPASITPKLLAISTLPKSSTSYIVAMANPTSTSRQYTLHLDLQSSALTTIQRIHPILAADGQLIFDPLDATSTVDYELAPGSLVYLLVTEPPGRSGSRRRLLVSDDTGWEQALVVNIRPHELIRPGKVDSPRVLVWAYMRDQPIWSPDNAQATVARLVDAGVNVFEIHPSDLPQPFSEQEWHERAKTLREQLALYRGHGLVLLFLGGDGWKRLVEMDDDSVSRRRLTSWLALLQKTFDETGYEQSDWALYLKDEPRGENLAQLAKLIDALRAIKPTLQFYSNPTSGRGMESSNVLNLSLLRGRVKFLQPLAGVAFDRTRKMLGSDEFSELWLYAVPPAPARSALPACYRELGRMAFDKGASGLGFWSFSDTFKSSAWSDFDGVRPDWAVVYEDRNSFVSSRRWEAFIQGVVDYKALQYCKRAMLSDPALAGQCKQYRMMLDRGRPNCVGWW